MKEIILTKRMVALVDDDIYELIKWDRWCSHRSQDGYFYAARNTKTQHIKMHRFIMGATLDQVVDHIDGNTLNNQRSNLRVCSATENTYNKRVSTKNSSGHTGICWDKRNKKWRASIGFNGKSLGIGRFKTIEDAIEARKSKEIELFGTFVRQKQQLL